jgi:hypothetical protein
VHLIRAVVSRGWLNEFGLARLGHFVSVLPGQTSALGQ